MRIENRSKPGRMGAGGSREGVEREQRGSREGVGLMMRSAGQSRHAQRTECRLCQRSQPLRSRRTPLQGASESGNVTAFTELA